MSLRIITNSELRTRRRCAREHHISYELGYRRAHEEEEALHFGSLVHLALAGWWLEHNRHLRFEAAIAQLTEDIEPFERARVVELIRGYHIRWKDEPLETIELRPAEDHPNIRINPLLAVECEFRSPLLNPATNRPSLTFMLGGKLDVLVLNLQDGRPWIVEHKTSSEDISAGSVYWQLLQLDTQVSAYYAGARALGFEPAGVIYDVLGKPRQRPLTATPEDKRKFTRKGTQYARQRAEPESPAEYAERIREAIAQDPDHYYVRGQVVRLEDEERDAQFDVWQHARLIREAELTQRWPRNPEACRRFNRLCPYFDVCTGTATLEDTTKFRRTANVHEELNQEIDSHGNNGSSAEH